ncbi:hypothetical protein GCM10011371_08380 [Novosphingobium marinum]|uniref:Uncharacterized protein n=1 Tax=Novosphingobium marinum TaxID=1514948 RepID=A0A7Y9XTX5_9SPHN|nr:hypothetical protein [Novosphingobium marinum]NYH94526.1 hypothetical protein [Novosphingobium marinum]GGC23016.1 hypothetical protein GCM10011371_08380 [Novosphingobium marinum]
MTVINSFVQGDRAYLLTDTAWLESGSGKLLMSHSKIIEGGAFPWALALTGDAHLYIVRALIEERRPRSAREFVETLPATIAEVRDAVRDPTFTMGVRLAAWCEDTGKARIFHLDTDADRCAFLGIDPWEVCEIFAFAPLSTDHANPVDRITAEVGKDITPEVLTDPGRFDPEADGLRLIEAQRRHLRFPVKGSEPVAVIGGSAQLTCVSREGVASKILRIWGGDEVGEVLRPEPEPERVA